LSHVLEASVLANLQGSIGRFKGLTMLKEPHTIARCFTILKQISVAVTVARPGEEGTST